MIVATFIILQSQHAWDSQAFGEVTLCEASIIGAQNHKSYLFFYQ